MRFNQSITRFFCFTVSTFLFASPFLVGCGEDLPETATVKVEVSSPKVLKPTDALRLIVSTGSNTKKELSITQDFNQTFQLDPDEPRIFVQLINASSESVQNIGNLTIISPGPSMSVRLTVLIDDEVEYDEEKLLAPGGWIGLSRSFS